MLKLCFLKKFPQREKYHQTSWASLTQQISQCCVAHWVASVEETPDAGECEKLEVRWWVTYGLDDLRRGRRVGWVQDRLGVERAGWPCIRRINYWSAGGETNMRTEGKIKDKGCGGENLEFLFPGNSFIAGAYHVAARNTQNYTPNPHCHLFFYIYLIHLHPVQLVYPNPSQMS